jgi:hypothetical protein
MKKDLVPILRGATIMQFSTLHPSKKAIKVAILDAFRGMADADEFVLRPGQLWGRYYRQLKPHERSQFHEAIVELRAKGLVEHCGGGLPLLKLTLKGERLLFSA